MQKNKHFQVGKNEYFDLNDPKENFKAFTWVCTTEDYFKMDNYLINIITNKGLNKFLNSEDYCRIKLIEVVGDIFKIFGIYRHSPFLIDYLLDYNKETDLVKKSRLNQLLTGLIKYIDYQWENGGVIIDYSIKKRDNFFINENMKELHTFHFLMCNGLKNVYDLIWEDFSVFVDKDKFIFNYFYSNKEQTKKNDELSKNISDQLKDVIKKCLFRESAEQKIFEKYELRLIENGFLSSPGNNWLKSPASFIRFYNYCENKRLFKDAFNDSSKESVGYLRILFNYQEGTSLDGKGKRMKQNNKRNKLEYSFLNIDTNFK